MPQSMLSLGCEIGRTGPSQANAAGQQHAESAALAMYRNVHGGHMMAAGAMQLERGQASMNAGCTRLSCIAPAGAGKYECRVGSVEGCRR